MHSVVFTRLQKLNLIDFIPDSRGEIKFPTYLGYNVVVDDGVPAVAGRTASTTRPIWSAGAFGFAEVPPAVPVEVDRKAAQGDGRGRRGNVDPAPVHHAPLWHQVDVSTRLPASRRPMRRPRPCTNWDRVYPERKQIPLAELVTNG